MTYKSGYPNRILVNQYREVLEQSGCEYKLFITQLADVGTIVPVELTEIPEDILDVSLKYVRQHKSKFATSLKHLDERDLIVSGFFLVATKDAKAL